MVEMNLDEIRELLDQEHIGRLGMASADGHPYIIPLPFCWLDGALYLRIPLTGRKGQILAQNDRVCFEVDQFTESMDHYASVLIEGRLVEVIGLNERSRVREANRQKYLRLRSGHRPGHGRSTPLEDLAMRKIVVQHISGRAKGSAIQAQQAPVASAAVV